MGHKRNESMEHAYFFLFYERPVYANLDDKRNIFYDYLFPLCNMDKRSRRHRH